MRATDSLWRPYVPWVGMACVWPLPTRSRRPLAFPPAGAPTGFVVKGHGDDPDADPDANVAFVEELLETHRVGVVFPTADGTIEALRRARERLRPHVALALADEAALELAADKEKTLADGAGAGPACAAQCDLAQC